MTSRKRPLSPLDRARQKISELHQKKDVALTPAEISALREWCYPDIVENGHLEYTCDQCIGRETCPYIFDAYNTGGDCLASK